MPPPSAIDEARLQILRDEPPRAGGEYVLYWMQQSQRAEDNHALEYAIEQANDLRLPLVVCFGLMDDYPGANERHYFFLLQGLQHTAEAVRARGASFVLQHGAPPEIALHLARKAALVVCDRGYLRHQKAWRRALAEGAECRVVQVESDVIVPLAVVSNKPEFAARTIRPKIYRTMERFLQPVPRLKLKSHGPAPDLRSWDLSDPAALCARLKLDRTVPPVPSFFPGGTPAGKKRFQAFCRQRLRGYASERNAPEDDAVSRMSAYLHFGQVSPLWMALEVREHGAGEDERAFTEELLVRRELAMNYVEFQPHYDTYEGLPEWARKTLAGHARDTRPHQYTLEQLEQSETHDRYWNAAMREMRLTGYLHNHLRMYWGKKILEWSRTPEQGYEAALTLNNRFFLCGRDAASYMNISWVFGLHDRPWGEREIFGKVRCMTAGGLERKCDMPAYLQQVAALPEP